MTESGGHGILNRLSADLERCRRESEFRRLEVVQGVNLCSNDYLGLAGRAEFKQAVLDAVARSRSMGSTGSRLLSGNAPEWEELESEFARFAGTESALYFGSGYAANVGLLGSILKRGDVVFSDEFNHASLIDGMRLSGATKIIYPHLDLAFLEKALAETDSSGSKLIVTESLFGMEGDIAPLDELLRLGRKYGAELVVDEAHATGVCGPHGRGILAGHRLEGEALAILHTCGKALASVGGFVCGASVLKSFLVNRARTFIFSTATPPYLAGQIRAALEFVRHAGQQRAHLAAVAAALREELEAKGFRCGSSAAHIVPVLFPSNEIALYVDEQLQARGFAAKAIRPPTVPAGKARIRFSLTSGITIQDVHRLVSAMCVAVDWSAPAFSR